MPNEVVLRLVVDNVGIGKIDFLVKKKVRVSDLSKSIFEINLMLLIVWNTRETGDINS